MEASPIKKIFILFLHAMVIWVVCAAVMGVGLSILPLQTTLTIHAIVALVISILVTFFYFTKFGQTTPLGTALFFVIFIMLVDFFLVALIINKSLAMFASFLGTWLPFMLIFTSSYITGRIISAKNR